MHHLKHKKQYINITDAQWRRSGIIFTGAKCQRGPPIYRTYFLA